MVKPKRTPLILMAGLLLLALLLYLYGERWLRRVLLYLSHASWAREIVTNFPPAWLVASRFVAGETIEDALNTTRTLNSRGMSTTMDFLGESVTDPTEAAAARDHILEMLDRIHQTGLNANVSVKLSQLGLKLDPALAQDNLRLLLERARQYNNKVRIDMEESALVDVTLKIYHTLRFQERFDNVGVVIQAYLYRSEADVQQLVDEGAWVRLCKGAYMEPADIAYPAKADTDANYVRLAQLLLSNEARHNKVYAAMATHDEKMIQAVIDFARQHNIPPHLFEFQMLFGIRRELQEALVAQGYQMRIYVPYGTAWYPYFMRRLAERPANLWFFISNFFRR